MKIILYILSMVIAGVIVGGVAFDRATKSALAETGIKNGPWMTNTAYGDKDAPQLLKAAVARRGLFALKVSETIYFTAFTDSEGDQLNDKCSYVISGKTLPSRWWSFTVYGQDDYLIDNQNDEYSVFSTSFGNNFSFIVAPKAPEVSGTWLPTAGGGDISITLRLYHPMPELYDAVETYPLPKIEKRGCA